MSKEKRYVPRQYALVHVLPNAEGEDLIKLFAEPSPHYAVVVATPVVNCPNCGIDIFFGDSPDEVRLHILDRYLTEECIDDGGLLEDYAIDSRDDINVGTTPLSLLAYTFRRMMQYRRVFILISYEDSMEDDDNFVYLRGAINQYRSEAERSNKLKKVIHLPDPYENSGLEEADWYLSWEDAWQNTYDCLEDEHHDA